APRKGHGRTQRIVGCRAPRCGPALACQTARVFTPSLSDAGPLAEEDKMTDIGEPVYWRGRQWAVTAFGVEALNGKYRIRASDVWQDETGGDWLTHMRHQY